MSRRPNIELPDHVARYVETHPEEITKQAIADQRQATPWRDAPAEEWTPERRAAYRAHLRQHLNRPVSERNRPAIERLRQQMCEADAA